MSEDVYVIGAGLANFGKHLDKGLKELGLEVITKVLNDASIAKEQLEAAYFSNAMGGIMTGQECVAGQIVLQHAGIHSIPVYNIENACASGSSALQLAMHGVRSGATRLALVIAVEKLYHKDRNVTSKALAAASDVELLPAEIPPSFFIDTYAEQARRYMEKYRCGVEVFAEVAVKNRQYASLNPHAQYRNPITIEQVLSSPMIANPLTRLMCSPISDGAAAIIIGTKEFLTQGKPKVRIGASQNVSGGGRENIVTRAAQLAYREAGVAAADISLAEVHDATSQAEIELYEKLGLCEAGEGYKLVLEGITASGGKIPVNTSGGLLSKGHPIAVSGVAQIIELYDHLRENAGERQVKDARVGMAQNAGGWVSQDAASCSVHILQRMD